MGKDSKKNCLTNIYVNLTWKMQIKYGAKSNYLHYGRIHLPLNRTLMDDTSVKWSIIKTFFVFHPILMKLGEVVVHMGTTTSPSFIKIGWKTKKF